MLQVSETDPIYLERRPRKLRVVVESFCPSIVVVVATDFQSQWLIAAFSCRYVIRLRCSESFTARFLSVHFLTAVNKYREKNDFLNEI